MAQGKRPVDRRKFLAGLLTGGGAVAALAATAAKATPEKRASQRETAAADPILYRRTPEAERYYRTLYV